MVLTPKAYFSQLKTFSRLNFLYYLNRILKSDTTFSEVFSKIEASEVYMNHVNWMSMSDEEKNKLKKNFKSMYENTKLFSYKYIDTNQIIFS